MHHAFRYLLLGYFFILSTALRAAPPCYDAGQDLPIDDEAVLQMKTSTPNQFLARAHIQGTLVRVYPHEGDHTHLKVQLDTDPKHTLEVIYNDEFGELPPATIGMNIEACGDYITSIAPAGHYKASPDGAILHWIHRNPGHSSHEDGYLIMGQKLCGG